MDLHWLTGVALVLALLAGPGTVAGQGSGLDSLTDRSARPRHTFTPNPQHAVLYGLVPGGGQIYNRRYWKLPIVYGALGGLYYYADQYRQEYQRFKVAYTHALNGEPHEFSSLNLPNSVLKTYRDYNRKRMEEGYIFMSVTYLLSIAEAYVDAHLRNFDISEDLSARIKPVWIPGGSGIMPALSLTLTWDPAARPAFLRP